MKFRALALATILATLSLSALAQNDKQTPQTPATPTQTQPADQTQAQPAGDQSQTPPDATQPQDADKSKDPKVKHDGGKKDVDSIGNRKVGGLDWYSIETDIKIG